MAEGSWLKVWDTQLKLGAQGSHMDSSLELRLGTRDLGLMDGMQF